MALNQFTFMGRLTGDPENRSKNGLCIAKGTTAVDRTTKGDQEKKADFFDWTAFGKTAEAILGLNEKCSALKKGELVVMWGEMHIDSYTDKEGVKRKSHNVTLNGFSYCEAKKDGAAPVQGGSVPDPQLGYTQAPPQWTPQAQPVQGQPVPQAAVYGQPVQQPWMPQGQAPVYSQPTAGYGQPPVGSLQLNPNQKGFI